MKIAKGEILEPVMSGIPFKSLNDVITRANCTDYGLAAAGKRAQAILKSVRPITVWVDCYNILDTRAPPSS